MKFSWTDPLGIIIGHLSLYYRNLEDFWTKDEPNEGMKVKMRIVIFVSHFLFGFFAVLPFINPYFAPSKAIFALVCVSGYFIILRRKNRSFLVFYFLINAVFTLFMSSKSYIEMFRIITVILAQHNHSVLMVNNKTLSFILMGVTLFFVSKSQANMNHLIEEQEYDKMIEAIRNMQYTWPLTYLFNQIVSMHMTTGYCQVIEESQDTQAKLKAKNEELFVVNEKLKTTLSLLEKTNKELKDALSARELFIASVSHELRNPLNSMLGNIELLSLETKDQRWLTMLNTCKICGEVLLGLINNVLDVAKINAERLELNFQPGNIYKLIEKVWVVSTIKMRQQKIKGYLAIGANLPKYVNMDNHRLNQILLNLIGNATKFTKDGFVKVIITWSKNEGGVGDSEEPSYDYVNLMRNKATSHNTIMSHNNLSTNRDLSIETLNITENRLSDQIDLNSSLLGTHEDAVKRVFHIKSLTQLKVRNFIEFNEQDVTIHEKLSTRNSNMTRENGVLRIEIIDSGCGISESSIQRLFQPFTQADSSITRQYGGTGLGLYITKQLVQKMDGQIHVVSQKNVGSAFWISIPTQSSVERGEEDGQNTFKEEHKDEDGNLVGEPRVLIVDDDPLNQTIMTHYFKKLNMETEVAVNGQDAVTRFSSKRPHYYSLITMDIQMPVMDGLTACKEIRKFEQQIKAEKNVPIVIVTGNCIDLDKSQCLDPYGQIRASYFFRKPFKFEECQSCVKALFAKVEEEQQVLRRTQGKVMIVDDDVFNTEILRKYLEKYSFECEICRNGKEAIMLADKQKFRVVLMDCEMPEMDGYTATAHLRAKYPDLVIIGVTGSLKENCMKKAKESGMNDVETKPVNFQRLIKRIRGAYSQR